MKNWGTQFFLCLRSSFLLVKIIPMNRFNVICWIGFLFARDKSLVKNRTFFTDKTGKRAKRWLIRIIRRKIQINLVAATHVAKAVVRSIQIVIIKIRWRRQWHNTRICSPLYMRRIIYQSPKCLFSDDLNFIFPPLNRGCRKNSKRHISNVAFSQKRA